MIKEKGHVERGTLKKIPEPPSVAIFKNLPNDVNHNTNDNRLSSSSLVTTTTTTTQYQQQPQTKHNAVLIGNTKCMWPEISQWLSMKYHRQTTKTSNNNIRPIMIMMEY
uniref:Uncharacterized protein n=1 Tax=Eucampia antarctica TaxID=49252 RepID=A0A7S2WIC6_9STRA